MKQPRLALEDDCISRSCVALVRGVNLAGRNRLAMADLNRIARELGLKSARTVGATGNLLFVSARSEQELRGALERSLAAHMGSDVRVLLRSAAELQAIVAANPFRDAVPSRVQVFFMDAPPPGNLVGNVRNQADERIAAGVREVFVAYGERGIGRSRLRIPAAEAGTARNMNTVRKLAELAREMA